MAVIKITKEEIMKQLYFDKVEISLNPYHFKDPYEEKGSLVLLKLEQGSNLQYKDIKDICFQCPPLEVHEDLIRMVTFNFDKDNVITSYVISATKFKVLRDEILRFEKIVGQILEK
ncbi:MAG: hypothetical protein QM489_02155 [Candidatus Izemoplasma sp.]